MFKNCRWRILSILLLGLCLFIVLTLFNYTAILPSILGVVLAFLTKNNFLFLIKKIQHIRKKIFQKWVLLLIFFVSSIALILRFFFSPGGIIVTNSLDYPIIESYKTTLFPLYNLKEFQLREEIKLNQYLLEDIFPLDKKKLSTLSKQQLNRQIISMNKGLILKEVYIKPLDIDTNGYFNLKLVNSNHLIDQICKDICPKSRVELVNFPIGSFYEAQGGEDLKFSPYLDTETVSWSISNLERGIRFAYISPPYHHFRSFFNPFLKFASANKWIIVTITSLITFIYTPKFNQIINVKNISSSESKSMSQPNNVTNNLQGAQFAGGLVNAEKVNAHKIGGNITNNIQKQPTDTNNYRTKTILILAANPRDTSALRLDEEVREIDLGLQRAKKQERFDLKQRRAVRIQDVYQSLLDFKPQIIHFSGHGSGDDGLALEDEAGKLKLVDTEALARLFELFSSSIECIVLNACYSEIQAEAIVKHIPYVIGMNKAIGDKAAIKFATGFYNALGAGESVEFAYKLGCNVIQLDGISEHLTPVLKKKQ